jgi:cytochrome c553
MRELFGSFLTILLLVLCSCASTSSRQDVEVTSTNAPAAEKIQSSKGGAELWAMRCSQCHFARDPGFFSKEQWEVIMLHMRIRANLTAQEHRAILEFINSAN